LAGGETATAHDKPPVPATMSWIWLNAPFGVVAVAFTVGLPLWATLKVHEDAQHVVTKQDAPRSVLDARAVDAAHAEALTTHRRIYQEAA
jgi:hypothetical protein